MSNFVPNEAITINDKDPPWSNNKIKTLIKNKNLFFFVFFFVLFFCFFQNCRKTENNTSPKQNFQIKFIHQNFLAAKSTCNKINPNAICLY